MFTFTAMPPVLSRFKPNLRVGQITVALIFVLLFAACRSGGTSSVPAPESAPTETQDDETPADQNSTQENVDDIVTSTEAPSNADQEASGDAQTKEFGQALQIDLPEGWQRAGTNLQAGDADADGATVLQLNAVPVSSEDAGLSIIALPRLGLTLADYIEMVRNELEAQEGVTVERAGVFYGERDDGAPTGELEYQFAGGMAREEGLLYGYQAALLVDTEDQILIVSYVADDEVFPAHFTDIVQFVQSLDPHAAVSASAAEGGP